MLDRLFGISIWLYTVGLVAWAVAREAFGDSVFPVLALSYLGAWLFCPLLLLAPWAVLTRSKLGLLLLIPIVSFLFWYGPSFRPRAAIKHEPSDPVRVLSLNVRYDNADTVSIGDVLLSSQADVLALQEVSRRHAAYLNKALANTYPHSTYSPLSGLAIYSARPIAVQDLGRWGRAPFQSVVVQGTHSSFHLINAHLARVGILGYFGQSDAPPVVASATQRAMEIGLIQEAVEAVGLPAVVACDCNSTDLTAAYRQMTTTLGDAHRERGWGFGHTFLVPRGLDVQSDLNVAVQRIDYLLHSPDIEVRTFEVVRGATGSDHLPIVTELDLPTGAGSVP